MKLRYTKLVLLLGLAVGCAVPEVAPEQTPLESLIARHVEARGGIERLEEIRTVRMSGRAIAGPGREALVTREVRPPGRIRTEFTVQGVTAVYACDGSECWFVAPLSGSFEPELMSEEETSAALAQADLEGTLVNWKAKGHSVELLGKETIDGRETFKLEVTLSSGAVQIDYLDAESALLVRKETTRAFAGRTVEVAVTFGDFRDVGGVIFPHSIKGNVEGRPDVLEVIVEEAELNAPIGDERFEMP